MSDRASSQPASTGERRAVALIRAHPAVARWIPTGIALLTVVMGTGVATRLLVEPTPEIDWPLFVLTWALLALLVVSSHSGARMLSESSRVQLSIAGFGVFTAFWTSALGTPPLVARVLGSLVESGAVDPQAGRTVLAPIMALVPYQYVIVSFWWSIAGIVALVVYHVARGYVVRVGIADAS